MSADCSTWRMRSTRETSARRRATSHSLLEAVRRDDDPRAVGYYVFGAALARRLSKDAAEEANLYLNRFDVPQIHLFNLLAHEVPQVGLTTVIANRCIAGAIEGSAHPTVIDVGIGTAQTDDSRCSSCSPSSASSPRR